MNVKVTLCNFGLENGKGHVYTEENMKEAVKKYIENHKGDSVIYGELNPSKCQMYTRLGNISHKVDLKELDFGDDKISCDIELLDTSDGKIVQEMLKEGITPKFAPRMTGEYIREKDEDGNDTGKILGVKDLNLISIDIV